MTELPKFLPITMDNVNEAHNAMFAEWVKQLNIKYLEVTRGTVVADYTVADQEKFILGGVCGQVLMALMDTVFTVAVCTSDTLNKYRLSLCKPS